MAIQKPQKAAPAKKTATAVTASTQVKAPKVLATYNRALDCIALAAELARQGRTAVAARAFFQAVKDPSIVAAIQTLDATNAYGLQAMTAARLKAEAEEAPADEMSDEEIDRLLNGDDVSAEADPTDGLEDLEDMEDEPEEILEEADVGDVDSDDMGDDVDEDVVIEDDGGDEVMEEEANEFASVIARLTQVKAKAAPTKKPVKASRVVVKPQPQRRK